MVRAPLMAVHLNTTDMLLELHEVQNDGDSQPPHLTYKGHCVPYRSSAVVRAKSRSFPGAWP